MYQSQRTLGTNMTLEEMKCCYQIQREYSKHICEICKRANIEYLVQTTIEYTQKWTNINEHERTNKHLFGF